MVNRLIKFIILLSVFLYSSPTLAASRFNLLTAIPPQNGLVTVEDAKISPFKIGARLEYQDQPLVIKTGGTVSRSVVDDLFVQYFYGNIPLAKWFSMGLNIPVAWRYTFNNSDIANAGSEDKTSLGDLMIVSKAVIYDNHETNFGLALIPFVTLPTGDAFGFMGNDGLTGGAKFAIQSPDIGQRLSLMLNVGAVVRKEVHARNINFDEQFYVSGGGKIRLSKAFAAMAETEITTPFSDLFEKKDTSPAGMRAGIEFNKGTVKLTGGAGAGIVYGAGFPVWTVFGQFEWRPDIKKGTAGHYKTTTVIESKPRHHGLAPRSGADRWRGKYTVKFALNSALIKDSEIGPIGEAFDAAYYKMPSSRVKILGYADGLGKASYNKFLSTMRAERVKRYLEFHGIASESIDTQGLGGSGGSENRKAEIIIE